MDEFAASRPAPEEPAPARSDEQEEQAQHARARATSKAACPLTGDALDRAINEALKESREAFQRKDFARAEEITRCSSAWAASRLISNLALSIENQNRPEDALRVAEAGLESFPEDAHLWNLRGAVLKFLGELDEAREAFARAIEHDPRSHAAWRNHAGLKTFESAADPDIAAMEELLGSLPRGHDGRVLLYFALGRALDEAGETARAFEVLERQPRHEASCGSTSRTRGDMDATIAAFDETGSPGPRGGCHRRLPIPWWVCRAALHARGADPRDPQRGPGLESGRARSRRAQARSAGLRDTSPDALATLSDEDLRAIGRRYARASRANRRAGRPTDKYLTNYIHGGIRACRARA